MAGVITRSNHPELLYRGIKVIYGLTYDQFPTEYTEFFETRNGDQFQEKMVEITGFGLVPTKGEGAPIQYDTDGQGTVTNVTYTAYALGYMVTEEELEDGLYDAASNRRAPALAFSHRTTEEIVHANVLVRGFSTAYPIGDGQPFFSNAHPTLAGPQSNIPQTAADFSEASLEDMIKRIASATNARGMQIPIIPEKLIVSTNDMFNVTRVLNSQLRTGTNNNDVNAVKQMGMIPGGAAVNHYLGGTNAWYLKTNVPEGLISWWRVKPSLEKDNDFDTGNAKAKSRSRYQPAIGDWRCMWAMPPH